LVGRNGTQRLDQPADDFQVVFPRWCGFKGEEEHPGSLGRFKSQRNDRAIKFDYASNQNPNDNTIGTWSSVVAATAINTVITPGCDLTADASCSTLPGTRTVRYGTDPNTGAVTVTSPSPLNQTSRYTFDGSNRLTAIRLPASTVDDVDITYYPWGGASAGRVYQVIRPQGTWTYSYSADSTTATVTDPTSRQRVTVFNTAIARATSDTFAGRTTSYQYDSFGRVTRITAPQGNYVQYTYDGRGNVTQTDTVANANGGGTITTKASYDASCGNPLKCNKPNSTTDARSNVTSYAYDPTYGVVTGITPPADAAPIGFTYVNQPAPGGGTILVPQTQSQGGTTTTYAYPGSGDPQPSSVSVGGGGVTATQSFTYTSDGDVKTVSGPVKGMVTTSIHDVLRRVIGVVGPGANPATGKYPASNFIYDGNGRLQTQQQGTSDSAGTTFAALATTAYGYDAGGRRTSMTVSGTAQASAMSYGYDAADRPTTATVLMQGQGPDRTTTNGYDANGLLSTVTTASGTADASTITYGYTGNGKPASIQDGNGNITRYAYDGFDRPQTTTYADNSTEVLGYDAASNVMSDKRRDGQVIGYTYDTVNQVRTRSGAGLSNGYTYDTLGRLTSATGGSYNVSRTYDALGNLLTDTTGGYTVRNDFDAAARRTAEYWGGPSGWVEFKFDYLANGALAHVLDSYGTSYAAFTYDDLGRVTAITRIMGLNTTMTYGADLRLASLTHTRGQGAGNGPTNDVTFGYTYNPAGQIVGRTTSNDAYVYGAPASAQSYGVNALNQLAPTPTPFTYDARGNQTNVSNTPGATRTFDGLDRVTSASQGGTTTYLTYDALDRLAGVQAGAGGATRRVAWNGDEVAGELVNGANPIIYGNGPDGRPVVGADCSTGGNIGWDAYLTDERGSLVSEYSSVTGTRAYAYDAYGREAAGAQHPSMIGYAGGIALPGAGLVHFRARAYDPGTGRFVSADPIGVAGGINLYGYASGDPVNNIDPSGLRGDTYTKPVAGGWGSSNFAPGTFGGGGSDPNHGAQGPGWYGYPNGDGTYSGIHCDGCDTGASSTLAINGTGRASGEPAGTDAIVVTAQVRPRGFIVQHNNIVNPLDPSGISTFPPTPGEWVAIAKTLNVVFHKNAMGLRPHLYFNTPSITTGAILPSGNYTVYDLARYGRLSQSRLIVDLSANMFYYTNNHYDSFYRVDVLP